jgi:GTP cyclohydrolase II
MSTVEAAIAAVRRDMVVIVDERTSNRTIIVRTVESSQDPAAGWPEAVAVARPLLVLTAQRFKALRPASDVTTETILLLLPEGVDREAVRKLADPCATADPISQRHGEFPKARSGRLEAAAVKLMKLAGLLPAALVITLDPNIGDPGAWARKAGLTFVRSDAVADYDAVAARSLRIVAEARVPLADAEDVRVAAFRPSDGGTEHLAIIVGRPEASSPVLTRVHSACLTGDLLGSLRCDCGDQLRGAIRVLSQTGGGILFYLAQEGRGIGLINKLRAYELQDQGFDTVDANERLGFELDERAYGAAAAMLRQLGFRGVRLLTNNPAKVTALRRYGIDVVERLPHAFAANKHNRGYLRTKALRSGHFLPTTSADGESWRSDPAASWADSCSRPGDQGEGRQVEEAARAASSPEHRSAEFQRAAAGGGVAQPALADVEAAVRTLIAWAGDDPDRSGLARTPTRVAAAYGELFTGYRIDPALLLRRSLMPDDKEGRIVLLRDIRFVSFCEHHLLPFSGHVHVGYLPRRHLVGIGAIAAAVDALARRLQLQERLTDQLTSVLTEVLDPLGLAVIVDASHQCVAARGPKIDARLVTSRQLGALAAEHDLGRVFHALLASRENQGSEAAA